MNALVATLHLLGVRFADTARQRLTQETDRGSDTIEKVVWAVAAIAIAGIVVGAVTAYVTTKSGSIR